MKVRALVGLGLVALSLSAVACGAEPGGIGSVTNEVNGAAPIEDLTPAELKAELAKAVAGIEWTSEADYPLTPMTAPGVAGAPVNADAIKAAFNDFPDMDLLVGSTEYDFDSWMDVHDVDESDEYGKAYVRGITRARELMEVNLTNLKVVLMAETSLENTQDVGFLHAFIVGRMADGTLVALHTSLVWT